MLDILFPTLHHISLTTEQDITLCGGGDGMLRDLGVLSPPDRKSGRLMMVVKRFGGHYYGYVEEETAE